MGPAYRIVAQKLYNEGVDFLMGMLFREVFVVNQAIRDRITNSTILKRLNLTADTFSLALHSRHTVLGDIGDFINEEITCLQKLLPSEINRSQDTCIVFLMSDRQLTIDLLSVWLRNANCTPISAAMILSDDDTKNNNTDDNHPSRLKNTEHGERAGYGFIEDLLLSSHARTGYIGDIHRSSFMLLVEVMSYDRTMEAWADGRYDVLNDMIHCVTKQRSPSGYDYGPGTPTFKHHTLLQPLRPVEVFEQYKKWHGITSLTLYPDETLRTFAIAYYQCPFYGSNDNATVLFQFLNRK